MLECAYCGPETETAKAPLSIGMTREESTVKHPKKPELWSNVEISAETDGSLAAQEASRELRAEQGRERQVADDLDRFRERFLIEGGRECDVEAAFWQTRTARTGGSQAR